MPDQSPLCAAGQFPVRSLDTIIKQLHCFVHVFLLSAVVLPRTSFLVKKKKLNDTRTIAVTFNKRCLQSQRER